MKFSNEVKVGILAIVAIFIFVWGYNFLKGKDIFLAKSQLYIEYDRIDGLKNSAVVAINGFQVGQVVEIYLKEDGSGKIMVRFELNKGVKIPKSTLAYLISPDLLSEKLIALEFESPCEEGNCAVAGDTLAGGSRGMLESMVGDMDEYVDKAKDFMNSALDTLQQKLGLEGEGDIKEAMEDLKGTLKNLNGITGQLNTILARSSTDLTEMFANLNSITTNLKDSNEKINGILENTEKFTENLESADISMTLEKANGSMDDLSKTLASAEKAVGGLQDLMDKLNYGDGTAALLINDPKVYNNLNNSLRDLDFFLKDFRLNPKRYVNVSVFGKKQKTYEGVDDDPEGTESGENPNTEKTSGKTPEK